MLSTIFPPRAFDDHGLVERRVPVHVLVVDDVLERRAEAARVLRGEGFAVTEAASGAEGIVAAGCTTLDAVVLDLGLSDHDAFDLCRRLKREAHGLLPVLQLSAANASSDSWIRGLDAGVDGHLTHPFDANELRAAVHGLVRLKRHDAQRIAQATATELLEEALDALGDHIALLGPSGNVVAVNRAWQTFASDNAYATDDAGVGVNYCDVCETAVEAGLGDAHLALAGIRAVLAGERDEFEQEYACHSPSAERWFRLCVRRVVRPGAVAAIVTHTDRTREHQAARAADTARAKADAEHEARAADGNLFRSLTERSLEFVSILDAEGRFKYVSPSVSRSIGYTADDLLGTLPTDLVHPDDLELMLRTFTTLTEGGPDAVAEMTVRLRRHDGSWGVFEGGGQNLLHEPSVAGITCNARDVTARVIAERARAEIESRFRHFVESTHEGVAAMDTFGFITYTNPRLEELLGFSGDELAGRALFSLMPDDDAFAARTRFARLWRGMSDDIELRLTRRDGTLVDVLAAESPITNEIGECVGVLVMISDLTQRTTAQRSMEHALRAADLDRRRLEATLEAIPVGVWISDTAGGLSHANSASGRIWGGSATLPQDPRDYSVYHAFNPKTGLEIDPLEWPLVRTLASGETIAGVMLEIERFDGSRGFILNSSAAIFDADGTITGGVVISVDVTEHEAAARERERLVASLDSERTHLADVFERAPAFLAVARGPTHVFERVNPAYQQLVGPRPLIGRTVAEALPELAGQGMIELLDGVWATGQPFVGRQVPVTLARTPGAAHETRYIDFVFLRLDAPDGDHAMVAHGVDVTDQVLVTEKLRRNEQRLREQFAKLPVPTYLWERQNGDFILLDMNEAAERSLPTDNGVVVGKLHQELFPQRDDVRHELHRCLRDNIVLRHVIEPEAGAVHGARRFELTIGPQQPDRVLVHAVDTTERSALEAQLRQAQKMEAVGQLAGGVAHDFNNLLTVIGAHSAFLMESLDSSDPQHEDAVATQQAGIRAAGLTRQLLAFSRKQILRPQVLDLNVILTETRTMLSRLLGEDIQIVTSLESGLSRVVADPSQIDQVVMNLAVNARDAMPEGGRLTICTRAVHVAAHGGTTRSVVPPGEYVLLSIRDTGIGMDALVQARLFEPFFTTKEPGKGTGLGLATVYGIVKQSNGYLTVDSKPGIGTSFSLYLPAVGADAEDDARAEAEDTLVRGVETILLVEDERAVRAVARQVLSRRGYRVLEAENGHDALRVSAAFEAVIHLVVSDAVMPGMTGAEVVRRLTAQRPALRSLIMSGYTDDEIVRRGIVSSEVAFVQKPFSANELSHAVRGVLDS